MIRPASPDESETLTKIALEAKSYWGYPEHWIKHWESDLTISPAFIEQHQVYVVEQEGEVCGFYALCVESDKAELDHMWVRPSFIGTGLGKELFLHAMDHAARLNVGEVHLTADPNAAGFYERMGAEQIGEAKSEIDGKPRILPRMKIEL